MQLIRTVRELESVLESKRSAGQQIGFVPTMGALHDGHLSLIRMACEENDVCVCSIFVNPLQFNDKKDLEKYPRDLEGDLKILEDTKCAIVFHPDPAEMYPNGAPEPVDLGPIEHVLEGHYRPGHFSGVSTVVRRLFEVVGPHRAYFGLKDYQQYLVVKTMVRLTGLKVEIIGCETKREADGLAMSSRNRLLSVNGRKAALLFYDCLKMAKKMVLNNSIEEVRNEVDRRFQDSPECDLEYFEIVGADDLMKKQRPESPLIACIAGYVEGVRLIDNLILIP